MKFFAVALIYIAFVTLIGDTVYLTDSALPLFGLLLSPSVRISDKENVK